MTHMDLANLDCILSIPTILNVLSYLHASVSLLEQCDWVKIRDFCGPLYFYEFILFKRKYINSFCDFIRVFRGSKQEEQDELENKHSIIVCSVL